MPLSMHAYLVFIASVVVLCIVPGPDMAYMLGRTVTQGRRAGLVAAIGINMGGYAHVAAAVLGLSAILASSAVAFTVVKIRRRVLSRLDRRAHDCRCVGRGRLELRRASAARHAAPNILGRLSQRRLESQVSVFFPGLPPAVRRPIFVGERAVAVAVSRCHMQRHRHCDQRRAGHGGRHGHARDARQRRVAGLAQQGAGWFVRRTGCSTRRSEVMSI